MRSFLSCRLRGVSVLKAVLRGRSDQWRSSYISKVTWWWDLLGATYPYLPMTKTNKVDRVLCTQLTNFNRLEANSYSIMPI